MTGFQSTSDEIITTVTLGGKQISKKALLMMIAYAQKITKDPVWEDTSGSEDPDFGCMFCSFMGDADQIADESLHAEDCVWRLLKETIANLTNLGY